MGSSLYPASLASYHYQLLKTGVFGNTHLDSPACVESCSSQLFDKLPTDTPCRSTLSESHIKAARTAVLNFFDAPLDDYVCVFTSNATGALKIVGESYPFSLQLSYVLSSDSHNSMNGIQRFAQVAGAKVRYLAACPHGGFGEAEMKVRHSSHSNPPDICPTHRPFQNVLASRQPKSPSVHCLFTVTAQSNITGHRPALNRVVPFAKQHGFDVLLDTAGLAPSSCISLRQLNSEVDGMAISFYKMFGYPTGVGALVVWKDFLVKLRKPYFGGGTVGFVQVPGTVSTCMNDLRYAILKCPEDIPFLHSLQEGTSNYANLPAITYGLHFLSKHIDSLPGRLSALHHYLHNLLTSLQYSNGAPLVRVHTAKSNKQLYQLPQSAHMTQPAMLHTSLGGGGEVALAAHLEVEPEGTYGYVVSSTFLSPMGDPLSLSFVSHTAAKANISL